MPKVSNSRLKSPVPSSTAEGGIMWNLKNWPVWLLVGLVLLFFWDSYFGGKVLCFRDPSFLLQNAPQFVSKALKTNEFFPLWNPFIGHGKPHLADPETAFFYPVNWVYYIFSLSRALSIAYGICVFTAGLSVYALARHWKMDVFPALCGAISLMFSSWVIAMLEFRSHIGVFTWVPVELLVMSSLLERARNPETAGIRRNFWRIVAVAVTVSLQYLAGYPQMMIFGQFLVGGYVVARVLWLRNARVFFSLCVAMTVAGVITVGLCMAQFLPSWEFIKSSERSIAVDPGLDMASYHPMQYLSLLFPFLFGRSGYPNAYWGITVYEFWAGTCFIGIFPLIVATFSPFCLKRFSKEEGNELHRFLFFFFLAVAILALVFSAGKYFPAYMLLNKFLPGFSHFRWPSKFLVFLVYALPVLASLGFQQILNWNRSGRKIPVGGWVVFAGWGMILLLTLIGLMLGGSDSSLFETLTGNSTALPLHAKEVFGDYCRGILFLALGLGVVGMFFSGKAPWKVTAWTALAVTFINLFLVGREIQPIMDKDIYELPPKTLHAPFEPLQPWQIYSTSANAGQYFYGCRDRSFYQWAKDAAIQDVLQPFGMFQEHTVGLKLLRYQEVNALLETLNPPALRERLADVMNIRYVVQSQPFPQVLWNHASKEVNVLDRSTALPKAYVVDRWRLSKNFEESIRTILTDSFDLRRDVVLELMSGQSNPDTAGFGDFEPAGDVQRLHYQWNSVDMTVSAKRQALLVLTDTWFPGWKATVNGKEVPIYLANGLFRAIPVQPGNNEIVFCYQPQPFFIGICITLATLALLSLAGGIQVWIYFCRSRKLCGVSSNSFRKIFPR
ncbi:MAG: YfhO family protein [Chthoniobacteraceae bacterium]